MFILKGQQRNTPFLNGGLKKTNKISLLTTKKNYLTRSCEGNYEDMDELIQHDGVFTMVDPESSRGGRGRQFQETWGELSYI